MIPIGFQGDRVIILAPGRFSMREGVAAALTILAVAKAHLTPEEIEQIKGEIE